MRRCALLIDALLATPGSMLHRAAGGDTWTLTDHLLALVHDQLTIANWQRSTDGSKGRNRPKPLSPLAAKKQPAKRCGRTAKSAEEARAFLAQVGPAA